MMMVEAQKYTYRVAWSPEDEEFVCTVAEFPSLSWLDSDSASALSGAIELVADVLRDMCQTGETPPVPLSERHFSGRLQLRIPPETHRRLATEAAEEHVSLNRLIAARL